jgi:hypothetical protein
MARVLVTTIFLLSLSSGLTQAATQEAECYGGLIADDKFLSFPEGSGPPGGFIHQGSFRGLKFPSSPSEQFNEASGWENFNITVVLEGIGSPYQRWGLCVYTNYQGTEDTFLCGDASLKTQLCWSEDPFTLANTNNGETCVSTVTPGGVGPARDQTFYAISIDRSGAETTYCQIEFKTLATGDPVPTEPPGTGSTKVVGLAVTDPETDQTPDGPTEPWPGFGAFQAAVVVPFMPHILLIGMTVLLATLGLRRARRRNAA